MNAREKRLAFAVGGIVALFAGVLGYQAIMVKPLKTLDRQTVLLRERLGKLNDERRAAFNAQDQLEAHARRTFAEDVDQASARSGELLTRLIPRSGLRETDFTRLPVGPRKLRGASEIGWSVQGEGRLESVVNLLFQLQESPWVQRLENVVVTATERAGLVKVRFRYLTLVLESAPEVERTELAPRFALKSPERALYDPIIQRDLLRPYVKRPPQPPGPPATPPPATAPPAGPEPFQIVVSLSEWQGQPEIHVRDLNAQQTLVFKPGDTLAGGEIVMVDYRALPKPGSPFLLSHSRVIIKTGSEYWAIERGQKLTEKYRLAPEQLPEKLSRL